MVQRLNISLPDDLHGRLQAIMDKINVSGICREALMKVIEKEELESKNLPLKERLIERLKMTKEESMKKWKEAGFEEGKRAASEEMDYDDFQIVKNSFTDWLQLADDLDSRTVENELGWDILDDELKEKKNFNESSYVAGWIEGVMEVWESVKDEI